MLSRCDLCGAHLQEGDALPETLCVRCSTCGGLYAVTTAVDAPQRLDDGWEMAREGDVLHVSWSWSWGPVDLWLNTLVFLGLVGLGLAGLLGAYTPSADQEMLPWLLLASSPFIGYGVLLRSVNRTRIEASPRTGISVRHGPLPWFVLPRTVDAHELRQLYGQKRTEFARGKFKQVYQLRVLCRDGSSRKLVSKELSAEQVLFLERTLEAHLGVRERLVPGELKDASAGG